MTEPLTIEHLRRISQALRRSNHSGENYRIDLYRESNGMLFGFERGRGDIDAMRFFATMHRVDFGYCLDAIDEIPLGSMRGEQSDGMVLVSQGVMFRE